MKKTAYIVMVCSCLILNAHAEEAAPPSIPASALTLDQFLQQVQESHDGVKGAQAIEHGAAMRSDEASLMVKPSFFVAGQYVFDKRETMSPAFQGVRTDTHGYSLGFRELTPIGLNAELAYSFNYLSQFGTDSNIVPDPRVYTNGLSLSLTQSLWRNGFGRETRANQKLMESEARATSFDASFMGKTLLAEAENAYWKLALSRETVLLLRATVERAERIRDWNSRRINLQLSDKADLLQSQAGVLSRKLELATAIDDEEAARRLFNSLRGREAEEVSESLASVDQKSLLEIVPPPRAAMRDDVRAAEQYHNIAVARSQKGAETNRPTLDLFATTSLNGRATAMGSSVSESFTTKFPYVAVGVKFSMPTDLFTATDAKDGYFEEMKGAELNYKRKLFEQERLWNELTVRFGDLKERLKLAVEIQSARKETFDYERQRHGLGRTTTYQVLLFEQDFALSQLMRIRTEAELLGLVAQMKTFSDKGVTP